MDEVLGNMMAQMNQTVRGTAEENVKVRWGFKWRVHGRVWLKSPWSEPKGCPRAPPLMHESCV